MRDKKSLKDLGHQTVFFFFSNVIPKCKHLKQRKMTFKPKECLFWHAKLYFNQPDKGAIDWPELSTEGHSGLWKHKLV